ncbi:DsbA family protein [Thalassotalea sp. PP2-459]|uniref:DsbA family oxidoreductase n=1 Tax=Thalassotalea sp. PP2-459 TaxID=1742724 RepID=UPI000942E6FF|nr:DsbA family protein [Thalassotalea sp. PP2-459]OKY25025.1 DsbA family protein [Thalassotalea sp. PP2-459]
MLQIEFFHDAVCGWCYVLSPRLRRIVENFPVKIKHRAFVLQRNESEMIKRFGSMSNAKHEILGHWQSCKKYADNPNGFNIEGMRQAKFDYPSGYLAAKYAKAIESIFGQNAHWDFFDAVQTAHLYHNKNIANASILNAIVDNINLPQEEIASTVKLKKIDRLVEFDNERASQFFIKSIPSIIINGKSVVSEVLSQEQLEALVIKNLDNYKE